MNKLDLKDKKTNYLIDEASSFFNFGQKVLLVLHHPGHSLFVF